LTVGDISATTGTAPLPPLLDLRLLGFPLLEVGNDLVGATRGSRASEIGIGELRFLQKRSRFCALR
jgi:hypothetical protein